MSNIVVYTSGTGFTEKYAKWIGKELQCEVSELKKTDVSTLNNYDTVIYGGWVMAGMVSGYNKLKNLGLKNLIVFSSGITISSDAVREKIAKQNDIPLQKFFYFEGGYAPNKVGFFGKMIIHMITSSIKKKEDKTKDDVHMLETTKGADHTDKNAIVSLIEFVHTV